jgi:hypothetical protein
MPVDVEPRAVPMPRLTATADGVPAAIAEALARLTRDHREYFPEFRDAPRVTSVTVQRRRLSDVAAVRLAAGAATARIYVKHHRKETSDLERVREKAGREFRVLGVLQERFRETDGCAAARPIAFFPDLVTVVTDAIDGENLHHLITRQAPLWRSGRAVEALREHCRATGHWLRRFQEVTATGERAPLAVPFILEHVRGNLGRCVGLGLPAGLAERALVLVERHLERNAARTHEVVGQHPDFQPDNVLVAPGRVTGLDFTSFQHGSPFSDLARFAMSVEFFGKSPLYRPARLRHLVEAFMTGYGWRRGDGDAELLPYAVLHMVRTARLACAWPGPLQRVVSGRVMSFLARWTRDLLDHGDGWTPLGATGAGAAGPRD